MKRVMLEEVSLTKADVIRALATGMQNIAIDTNEGAVVYAVDTKQSGNMLIFECTDGSVINITVEVR